MRRRIFLFGAAIAGLAACSRQQTKPVDGGADNAAEPPAPPSEFPDPAGIIRPLYDRYMTEGTQFPPLEQEAPWSAALLAQLQAMNARSRAINEPILDFDPLVNAQDYRLADVNVTTEAVVANSHGVVRAQFTNFGRAENVLFDMTWEEGAWRVDNVRGEDWSLREIAAAAPAP